MKGKMRHGRNNLCHRCLCYACMVKDAKQTMTPESPKFVVRPNFAGFFGLGLDGRAPKEWKAGFISLSLLLMLRMFSADLER